MKHTLTPNIIAIFIVLLIILPCNSFYFQLFAQETNGASFYGEIQPENQITSNKLTSYSEKPQTTKSTRSIRDYNNNKISDHIDSRVEKGSTDLDLIIIYNRQLSMEDIQKLNELEVQIGTIYWNLDMVGVLEVPVEMLAPLSRLPGVLRLENYGKPILYSDIATPTVKARESDLFSPFTAWELGYQGVGANIAVMDTGVDNAHPSLAGKWVGGVDLSKPETFFTPRDGTHDADDTNGHGTTCSGIAMGTGAPEGTYMGAAPEAKLVDIRIGTTIGYAPGEITPQSFYDASLEGINWLIQHKDDSWQGQGDDNKGIDILSLSWGIDVGGNSDGSDAYSTALDRAAEAGIIICHAAGNSGPNNDGFDGFAAASNGISVASSDDLDTIIRDDDIIAEYSSRGPRRDNNDENPYNELKPDITAPGTHINQAQFDPVGDGSGNGYGSRGSGTSYAAPVIAGVCALMLEANPNLTNELMKEILHITAERRGEPTLPKLDPFWNKDFGWGVVDAYKAVSLSASLDKIQEIDIDLQCYITAIESAVGNESIVAETITINGVAFSKEGNEIEKLEITIGNGSWKTIENVEEDGIYSRWQYKFDTNELPNGLHAIKVRAKANDHKSLEHSEDIMVQNTIKTKEEPTAGNLCFIAMIIGVLIAVIVIIYFYRKRNN